MPESIGQKLKAARESRRLTLDQAADITRVRALYLLALENDDYSVMVSAAQGRGFLRLYSDFLGLNVDELTAGARENKPDASPASVADSTPTAESTIQATPVPNAKPTRAGFWARLLRRDVSATPADESERAEGSAPEFAPVTESVAVVPPVEEAETVKPAEKTFTAKKPARKKSAATKEKPKSVRQAAAGKKKRTTR